MALDNGMAIELAETDEFQRWFGRLRDDRALTRINLRLERIKRGHFGDIRSVGDGVYEMRIHYGPGYRLYYIRDGATIVVLLCGGDKDSQVRDIQRARRLAVDWRSGNV